MPDEDRAALASLLAEAYRIHAGAFLVPTPTRRAALLESARSLLAVADESLPWERTLREWTDRVDRVAAAAEPAHLALFEVGEDGPLVPPLAAAYLREDSSRLWEPLPEAEAFCAHLGVQPRRRLGGRADHVSVELELMAILCRREAEAAHAGRAADADAASRDAERFLANHLLVWFPRFLEDVRRHDTVGVASSAAASTHALLSHEHARSAKRLEEAAGD